MDRSQRKNYISRRKEILGLGEVFQEEQVEENNGKNKSDVIKLTREDDPRRARIRHCLLKGKRSKEIRRKTRR